MLNAIDTAEYEVFYILAVCVTKIWMRQPNSLALCERGIKSEAMGGFAQ